MFVLQTCKGINILIAEQNFIKSYIKFPISESCVVPHTLKASLNFICEYIKCYTKTVSQKISSLVSGKVYQECIICTPKGTQTGKPNVGKVCLRAKYS